MPRKPRRVPSYCLHKASGQAVVRLDGRDHYLGKHGSASSREAYATLVAEWLTRHTVHRPTANSQDSAQPNLTVNELILAYWMHARTYYVKNGRPTGEQGGIKAALKRLRRLYGRTPAKDFSPLRLKAVRTALIDAGLSRPVINQYVNRIRRAFRWAAENELVPAGVYHALQTVAGLRRGRSPAKERPPVRPVPAEDVEATLPLLPEVVQAMVRFQSLTGCRPEDVYNLQPRHIERSSAVWRCCPGTHKMEHTNRSRVFFIGPKAQQVLKPYLARSADAFCFSPRESAEAQLVRRRSSRSSCPRRRTSRRTKKSRMPGDRYTRFSYNQAVKRACRRANVSPWCPNQLRHLRATEVRKQHGIEAAQVMLGHARADVTEVYAEKNLEKAIEIARESG